MPDLAQAGQRARIVLVEMSVADPEQSTARVTNFVNEALGVLPPYKQGPLLGWRFVTPVKDSPRVYLGGKAVVENPFADPPAAPRCPRCGGTNVQMGRIWQAQAGGTRQRLFEHTCRNSEGAAFWI